MSICYCLSCSWCAAVVIPISISQSERRITWLRTQQKYCPRTFCINQSTVTRKQQYNIGTKFLELSHGVLQLLKKNFYSVLLLHLLKPLFSVFHGLQALSFYFVLVNDLYICEPLEANKTGNMHIPVRLCSWTHWIIVEFTPSPAVCIRSFNRIFQSKSMHIMPRGILKLTHLHLDISSHLV